MKSQIESVIKRLDSIVLNSDEYEEQDLIQECSATLESLLENHVEQYHCYVTSFVEHHDPPGS